MIELADCERFVLSEIADPKTNRRDIAKTYALILRSSECDDVDWAKVHTAIISRWSKSGLKWVKTVAWSGKAFEESA